MRLFLCWWLRRRRWLLRHHWLLRRRCWLRPEEPVPLIHWFGRPEKRSDLSSLQRFDTLDKTDLLNSLFFFWGGVPTMCKLIKQRRNGQWTKNLPRTFHYTENWQEGVVYMG